MKNSFLNCFSPLFLCRAFHNLSRFRQKRLLEKISGWVLSSDGNTLEIDIKVNDGNNAHWSFKFVKE
jgi:hypothetical protein